MLRNGYPSFIFTAVKIYSIHLKLLMMLSGINGKTGEHVDQLLDLVLKQGLIHVPHLAVHLRMIVTAFARMDLSLSYQG